MRRSANDSADLQRYQGKAGPLGIGLKDHPMPLLHSAPAGSSEALIIITHLAGSSQMLYPTPPDRSHGSPGSPDCLATECSMWKCYWAPAVSCILSNWLIHVPFKCLSTL